MSTTLQNSIWPNAGGTLGEIKTQIPDGVTIQWPDGDALVGNIVYKDGLISGFVDTKALTINSSESTTINYDYVNIELPFAEDAMTINRGPRNKYLFIKFNNKEVEEGGSVIVTLKYKGCKTVDDVKAVDPNYKTTDIIDGVWSEGLGDLEYGLNMFMYCSQLESFSSDLSSLTDGNSMFTGCYQLALFSSDLSNLTDGIFMFSGCENLTSFSSDLSSLTNGDTMFNGCYRLESFNSDLSSLTNGLGMFSGCKLNTASVQNIADTIKDVNSLENTYAEEYGGVWKYIYIGIGNSEPNEQEEAAFNTMVDKGWTIYVNGSQYTPTSPAAITTLDENGEETTTPIPYYAKPVQTDEKYAKYIDSEGNYYKILGAQFIYGDDISTYGMFTCEADAAANMRLTPYTKN